MMSPSRWTWPAGLLLALPLATSLVVRLDATAHTSFARSSSCSRDSQPLMAQPHDPIGNAPVQGGRPQGGRSRFTGMAPSTSTASPGFTSASAAEQTRDSSPYAAVASPYAAVDYAAVRRELKLLMDNPSWDDGSLAPIFIRLAWHSSGTYDEASGTGGSNGAGMRFSTEAADPENAGLATARAFLEPVKRRFPAISYSDLWVLAAYVGIEHTGGPIIPFSPGRSDHQDESYWKGMSYGRLPAAEKYLGEDVDAEGRVVGWEGLANHVRHEVFGRMGFGDRETVALLCGGHVYGRCHPKASGYAGAWVEHPTVFSNEYATDMIEDDWHLVDHSSTWLDAQGAAELRPAPGKRQYVNQKPPGASVDDGEEADANQMMLVSDMILAWDGGFRQHLEAYARDEGLLRHEFGSAFKKLTELGCGLA